MAHLFDKLKLRGILRISVRCKHGPNHWSVQQRKKLPKDKALEHFDEYYGSIFGKQWEDIRASLLIKKNKHIAVINNFSDVDRTKLELQCLGAIHLKSLYNVYKNNMDGQSKTKSMLSENVQNPMDSVIENMQLSDIESVYPEGHSYSSQSLNSEEDTESSIQKTDALQPVKLQSIEADLNEIEIDANRVIESPTDQSMLYEYVPSTRLKGLDGYILESDYYKFYNRGANFKVDIVKESTLPFPEHLHPFTFVSDSDTIFPYPKRGSTGVSDYYLFDGGSLLPVLALDIKMGDVVLDMCAAPGGKAITILQTLMPRIVVANDASESRANKIHAVAKQYLFNTDMEKMFCITQRDAREIEDKDLYNKILVDVPCTTDRHSLHAFENNVFKPTRLKERLQLPELQSDILTNALKLVTVGGIVVYSTCSLSPVQNDGVVQVALKRAWEESDSVMVVKDMSEALSPLQSLYEFANIGSKYGHLVVPTLANNWGPMYFCKIERVR
ncbi:5-methylcytosine rRNA methyltransferase l(2)10685 [Halictus rubicundus]|uniref:5-methylcytosine rRNA methyltransferase l(2)10685 n=1 Tax=Halictus rubicundus TaxID=77578 RepID=UPI004035310D